ncbi:MAG: hypothetical protein KGL46_05045 [Hyphomicrobiales bacterium]|nr:hypothetical protein [Hyphomicrobiales bacterium]
MAITVAALLGEAAWPTMFLQRAALRRLVLCCFLASPATALAQMQLPGAILAAPETAAAPKARHEPKKKPAAKNQQHARSSRHMHKTGRREAAIGGERNALVEGAPKPAPGAPRAADLVGRTLALNGHAGAMTLKRVGGDIKIATLKLAGEQISRRGEACEVAIDDSIPLKEDGAPTGAQRYRVELQACPFTIDVLNGAVLASAAQACLFKAADCSVEPSGLWGQPAQEIGPQRAKQIERQRHYAEQAMRAGFRDFVKEAGKDRALVSRIARDQAGFSSRREELCRNYAREADHGYCALTLTQARVVTLNGQIAPINSLAAEEQSGAHAARKPASVKPAALSPNR